MSVIIAKHLTKTYAADSVEVKALQDVNLTIEAGAFLAFIGPSGSGSTFVKGKMFLYTSANCSLVILVIGQVLVPTVATDVAAVMGVGIRRCTLVSNSARPCLYRSSGIAFFCSFER